MKNCIFLLLPAVCVSTLLFQSPVLAQPGGDKKSKKSKDDSFYAKYAEKWIESQETMRDRWLKELNRAFPSRVSLGQSDAELAQWFSLLSSGNPAWERKGQSSKGLVELHDRVCDEMKLKKNASIRLEDFSQFAVTHLRVGSTSLWRASGGDPLSEADKLFQKLDRDKNGILAGEELPGSLRESAGEMDANRDGRIDTTEFRSYFQMRVQSAVGDLYRNESPSSPVVMSRTEEPVREVVFRPGKLPPGLPAWFATVDADLDGQLGLYEWRKLSLPVSSFQEMDLNGDGFLTPEELLRYLRQARDGAVEVHLPGAAPSRR